MSQRTVIVTGGNSGLGYYCTRAIATHPDWHVIVASRSLEKAQQAVATLMAETANQTIEAMELNLASLASVRQFATAFAARDLPPLQAIVANAGTQVLGPLTYTEDGFEMTFGVNHLGHFLLINLLLRHLVSPARIVIVSSGTHDPDTIEGKFNPPDYRDAKSAASPETDGRSPLSGIRRYSTSKLCNLLFAYELARRLAAEGYSTAQHPITVNAFDPGAVPGTGLTRDYNPLLRLLLTSPLLLRLLRVRVNSVRDSGAGMARLILDPALASTTAKYFQGLNAVPSSKDSYSLEMAAELWQSSVELVRLQPGETILQIRGL